MSEDVAVADMQIMDHEGENTIEFQDVTYFYPGASSPSLANVNLAIQRGSFVLVAGATGSGKSTLLKLARGLDAEYGGRLTGRIYVGNRILGSTSVYELGGTMGIVFQNPAYQLHQPRVIDEVMSAPMYQGLAWSECIDLAQKSIRGVVECDLLTRNPSELSSGQQQRVALSASLSMRATILLLDEPFSYLDSLSQKEYVDILRGLKSAGMTIVLATHDLEPVSEIADRVVLLSNGRVIQEGAFEEVVYQENFKRSFGCPLWLQLGEKLCRRMHCSKLPRSIDEFLEISGPYLDRAITLRDPTGRRTQAFGSVDGEDPYINVSDITFGYSPEQKVLKHLSLKVKRGEVLGLIGNNGSGKTTLAMILLGLLKPESGSIEVSGHKINTLHPLARLMGYVTQDPRDMLFETTVFDECAFGPRSLGLEEADRVVNSTLGKFGLTQYAARDPLSLSGGEQRLLTFADVIVNNPDILILDEPEFGLDPNTWEGICGTIREMQRIGKTIIMITHRLDATLFLCNRLAILSQGEIVAVGDKSAILSDAGLLSKADLHYESLSRLVKYASDLSIDAANSNTLVDALIKRIGQATREVHG